MSDLWGKARSRIVGRRLLELAAAHRSEIGEIPGAVAQLRPDGTIVIDFGRGEVVVQAAFVVASHAETREVFSGEEGLHILSIDITRGKGAS